MGRAALPALPILVIALTGCACAAGGFSDELLWTKQSWEEYTLPFPWSAFQHRTGDAASLGLEPSDEVHASLDGPFAKMKSRIAASAAK